MAKQNKVKKTRDEEAISRAELSRRSGLAERTIKRVEDNIRAIAPLTMNKLVYGFNTIENKKRNYTIEYLFSE